MSDSTARSKPELPSPRDFSVRWWNYMHMAICSLTCFVSVASVYELLGEPWTLEQLTNLSSEGLASILLGAISFALSCIVLLLDLINSKHPKGGEPGKYVDIKNMSKPVEGYILVFFCVLWIVATALMTKANGIAYRATNIYLSSWGSLFLSFYTLNDWTTEKEIISFAQLTHLSWTLKWWYGLFFTSAVVFGGTIGMFGLFGNFDHSAAILTLTLSTISMLFSVLWILAHYKLLGCCCCDHDLKVGSLFEAFVGVVVLISWIVVLAKVTTYGNIAPTVGGNIETGSVGSNIYAFSWASFVFALFIVQEWKAERAVEFAQTQEKHIQGLGISGVVGHAEIDNIHDDDDI